MKILIAILIAVVSFEAIAYEGKVESIYALPGNSLKLKVNLDPNGTYNGNCSPGVPVYLFNNSRAVYGQFVGAPPENVPADWVKDYALEAAVSAYDQSFALLLSAVLADKDVLITCANSTIEPGLKAIISLELVK